MYGFDWPDPGCSTVCHPLPVSTGRRRRILNLANITRSCRRTTRCRSSSCTARQPGFVYLHPWSRNPAGRGPEPTLLPAQARCRVVAPTSPAQQRQFLAKAWWLTRHTYTWATSCRKACVRGGWSCWAAGAGSADAADLALPVLDSQSAADDQVPETGAAAGRTGGRETKKPQAATGMLCWTPSIHSAPDAMGTRAPSCCQ